jgi:hypothetical protein
MAPPPLPAQVRTDAAGHFRAIGVPAGTQPVQVRTATLAPWRWHLRSRGRPQTVAVRVVLAAGVTCFGHRARRGRRAGAGCQRQASVTRVTSCGCARAAVRMAHSR